MSGGSRAGSGSGAGRADAAFPLARRGVAEGAAPRGGSKRPERVAEAFKEVLAAEIPRLKDPRVGFVTVTAVDVTPDLRRARVSYTVLGDDRARRATRAGLESARTHLRAELGHQVRLKFTPELSFEEDDGLARADQVERILHELEQGNVTEGNGPRGDGTDG